MKMTVCAYFNDFNGSSTRDRSPDYSRAEWEDRATDHISYIDGYRPGDPLIESMLNPHVVEADTTIGACEIVYAWLNYDERPNGKHERSLSVGDVTSVEIDGETTWHTVANEGFEPIEEPDEDRIERFAGVHT